MRTHHIQPLTSDSRITSGSGVTAPAPKCEPSFLVTFVLIVTIMALTPLLARFLSPLDTPLAAFAAAVVIVATIVTAVVSERHKFTAPNGAVSWPAVAVCWALSAWIAGISACVILFYLER